MKEQGITIDDGAERIPLKNQFGEIYGEITFNPNDNVFRERYFKIYDEIVEKQNYFRGKADEVEDIDVDNAGDAVALYRETCEFFRDKIDEMLGEGTSQVVFGDVHNMQVFAQLLEGLTPYLEKVVEGKVKEYAPPPRSKKAKRSRK